MTEKIYISLTSIYDNQNQLITTLESILKQTLLPDNIYLYLSKTPYLLDKGFNTIDQKLQDFLNNYSNIIIVEWVPNTGPYRKLLPLLEKEWNNNSIIITIDDDTVYTSTLIENLVNDYRKHDCVINYRGFTPNLLDNKLSNFNYKNRLSPIISNYLYNFPTGKGGILYHPKFFHKTNNLIFDQIYLKLCPTADDIWFYLIRIANNVNCYLVLGNNRWLVNDLTNKSTGLNINYNLFNNTKIFKNTLEYLINNKKLTNH